MKLKNLIKNTPRKYLLLGVIGISVLIIATILIIIFSKDYKIASSNTEGYKNYYSKNLHLSFDFPETYKVKKINDIFYISQNFNGKKASKPYFKIAKIDDFDNALAYLNFSTKESQKEYGNTFTPITEVLTTLIGDKYTSKITYNNFYNGELIVENRYAFTLDNKVYQISSLELEKNFEEINEISRNIISSFNIKND